MTKGEPNPGVGLPAGRSRFQRILEAWAEWSIAASAALVGLMVLLVFGFVLAEAVPVLTGRETSALDDGILGPDDIDKATPERVRAFLGLTPEDFRSKDRETLRLLMEVRAEVLAEERRGGADPGATSIRRLFLPFRWEGREKPAFVWQPGPVSPKYNLVPLIVGSLKVTVIALLVGVPIAIAAAVHACLLGVRGTPQWVRAAVEQVSAVPGVVLGTVAVLAVAPVVAALTGTPFPLNASVAGIALGLALVPQVFSLTVGALEGLPRELTRTALALGATPWQAAWRVALPAASTGILAAVLLAFGRALGETMIVLIASGNAPMLGWSPWIPARTLTATVAAELGETAFHGQHFRMLFVVGSLLFVLSLGVNLLAALVFRRPIAEEEGRR